MILVLCACLMVLGFGVSALVGIWRMYQEGTQEYKGLQEFVSEETETDESGTAKDTKKVEVDFASLKRSIKISWRGSGVRRLGLTTRWYRGRTTITT